MLQVLRVKYAKNQGDVLFAANLAPLTIVTVIKRFAIVLNLIERSMIILVSLITLEIESKRIDTNE